MNQGNILILLTAGQLGFVIFYGYRIIRFIARIEFQHEMMWQDFEKRTGRVHKRRTDVV